MENDNLKNETVNITNTLLSTDFGIGFNCEICGNVQSVRLISHKQIFPLCNECKKDLYEIIKDKRTPPTCA
jgi:hypothetical protein